MSRQSLAKAHQKIQELSWDPTFIEPLPIDRLTAVRHHIDPRAHLRKLPAQRGKCIQNLQRLRPDLPRQRLRHPDDHLAHVLPLEEALEVARKVGGRDDLDRGGKHPAGVREGHAGTDRGHQSRDSREGPACRISAL